MEEKAWKPACSLPGLGDMCFQQGLGTAHTEAGWRSEEEPLRSLQGMGETPYLASASRGRALGGSPPAL